MKIIFNESRKILNPRLLVVLIIFTLLYYYLFIGLPKLYSYDDSVSQTRGLYVKLYEELGPTISMEEYDTGLQEIKADLINQIDELVRENPVFSKMGIKNYDEYREYGDVIWGKANNQMTAKEKEFNDASSKFMFDDKPASDLVFQIQDIEGMDQWRYDAKDFGQTLDEAEKFVKERFPYESKDYRERFIELSSRQEISTISPTVHRAVEFDIPALGRLIMICCLLLLVPYYIGERRSGVIPTFAVSRTGRKIFSYQVAASMVSCSVVFSLQAVVYTVFGLINDIFLFWNCPVTGIHAKLWVDLTFGQYYLMFFALIWIFAMTMAIIGYLISRKAVNYVIGISIAIPVIVVGGFYAEKALDVFCNMHFSLWRHWTIPGALLIMIIVIFMVLRRDKKRDL